MTMPGKPTVSIIAAMARNRVIGINNSLPWHLPADFKHFKSVTLGKPVVMGRLTYESIGKPLPGRTNIIVTRDTDYHPENADDSCIVVHTLNDAIAAAGPVEEIMIIGGASFYAQALPHANRLYLTIIDEDFNGDAWFPEFDPNEWQETECTSGVINEKNPHPHDFVTLEHI